MSDEPGKILLGDTVISAVERGRGFFRRRKTERPPLTHCENCGTLLTGHYCANCGQPAVDYRRSFRHVITDVLDSFLSWDSKILATFWHLLTRPWKLTTEFLAGHRVRYMNPLRLYLIVSVIFFFIVNYAERRAEGSGHFKPVITDEEAEIPVDQLREPKPGATPPIDRPESEFDGTPKFVMGNPNRPKTTFELWMNQRLEERIGKHGDKATFFVHSLLQNLPYMMLACIPIFAFLLKILYFFRRVFYIDHLIYALHIHSFAYSAILVIGGAGYALGHWLPGLKPLAVAVLVCTALAQVFLSIRRVYRQNWFLSLFKFFLGGFIYILVLSLGLGATFFVTLAQHD